MTGMTVPLADVARLPHAARVRMLSAIRRQRALLDAQETRLLAVLATDPAPFPDPVQALDREWVREDVACALRVPSPIAHAKLADATDLTTRLPQTVQAMADGVIDLHYARRLLQATRRLPDPAAATVQRRVLARAGTQTLAQFAAAVRRAVLAADPRGAEQRHQDAVADRRVAFSPQDNAVTELWALLPTEDAARLQARLEAMAAEPTAPGDSRTADQRRADALTALAESRCGSPAPAGPAINVTVALSTLLHIDDQPAELNGEPIPAALARHLAFDPTGTWRRLVTDRFGQLLDYGRRTYRPPAPLDHHVRARDRTCRFPGCRRTARPATRPGARTGELDHITAWADGGHTKADNLHALCPRHHHVKHEAGWSVRRDNNGFTHWRSPSGHRFVRPPDPLPTDRTTETIGGPDPPPH